MKIKLLFISILLFVIACNTQQTQQQGQNAGNERPQYPSTGAYYSVPDTAPMLHIASPIIYDVIVKNPNPNDEWTEFCLKNLDLDALTKVIFNAVYQGKLTPYYYRNDDSIIPLNEVKKLEKQIDGKIGKLQFREDWYFDEKNLNFYKKVNSIIIGYEFKNSNNEIVGYKALFKVYFDKKHNASTR